MPRSIAAVLARLASCAALLTGCNLWISADDACDPAVSRVRWFPDTDGDGYGDIDAEGVCIPSPGLVDNASDCDDRDPTITTTDLMGAVPGLTQWFRDADNDGYGADGDTVVACRPPEGYAAREGGDCDDESDAYSLVCRWADVIAGRAWSCGLRVDGTVGCWGDTRAGGFDLGPLPREGVDALAGGNFVACALQGDGVSCSLSDLRIDLDDPVGLTANYYRACAWDAQGDWECAVSEADPSLPDNWLELSPPTGRVRRIALGIIGACAILEDSSLYCWGRRLSGSTDPPGGVGWTELAFGSYNACALDEQGGVACWGHDVRGEDFSTTPEEVGFVEIAGTRTQMCARQPTGRVVCWNGTEAYGAPPDDIAFTAVAAGGGVSFRGSDVGHACGVTQDGEIECWGHDTQGQTNVLDYAMSTLSLAEDASCGIRSDGTLTCWGLAPELARRPARVVAGGRYEATLTLEGELLFLAPPDIPVPQQTYRAMRLYSSATGADEALCALDEAGSIDCWGSVLNADVYEVVPEGDGFVDIAPGSLHACALDADGAVLCWANPLVAERSADAPADRGYVQIAAGTLHTCAVHQSGRLECWGDDEEGGVSGAPSDTDFVAVSVHTRASCGLHTDGGVSCWGARGAAAVVETPSETGFTAISVAHGMACALRGDGSVRCWGDDLSMSTEDIDALEHATALSLGNGGLCTVDTYDHAWCVTPRGEGLLEGRVADAALTSVTALALGSDHACAAWAGRLGCFGDDTYGQSRPALSAAAAVVVGARHTCALDAGGVATCWGDGRHGQASPPAEVWTQLTAGRNHTCGVTTDHRARCWGDIVDPPDGRVELVSSGASFACGLFDGRIRCWGSGDMADVAPPAGRFVALATGAHHACALDAGGIATCWGDDSHGQVSGAPPYTFVAIEAGSEHTCAIKVDGFVRCWGADLDGQASPPDPTAR